MRLHVGRKTDHYEASAKDQVGSFQVIADESLDPEGPNGFPAFNQLQEQVI